MISQQAVLGLHTSPFLVLYSLLQSNICLNVIGTLRWQALNCTWPVACEALKGTYTLYESQKGVPCPPYHSWVARDSILECSHTFRLQLGLIKTTWSIYSVGVYTSLGRNIMCKTWLSYTIHWFKFIVQIMHLLEKLLHGAIATHIATVLHSWG